MYIILLGREKKVSIVLQMMMIYNSMKEIVSTFSAVVNAKDQ
jgi:hypothetical protein